MGRGAFKVLVFVVAVGVLVFGGIQLVRPDIVNHNPPVVRQAVWSSAEGEGLARRACFDCHSNETVWPWYSNIAPVSWLVAKDVTEGREAMDFSDWVPDREPPAGVREEVIREGEMPLPQYLLMHPEARLTEAEKQILIAALVALQ